MSIGQLDRNKLGFSERDQYASQNIQTSFQCNRLAAQRQPWLDRLEHRTQCGTVLYLACR